MGCSLHVGTQPSNKHTRAAVLQGTGDGCRIGSKGHPWAGVTGGDAARCGGAQSGCQETSGVACTRVPLRLWHSGGTVVDNDELVQAEVEVGGGCWGAALQALETASHGEAVGSERRALLAASSIAAGDRKR